MTVFEKEISRNVVFIFAGFFRNPQLSSLADCFFEASLPYIERTGEEKLVDRIVFFLAENYFTLETVGRLAVCT